MKRPEGTTAKGTTTLGFIFRGGIILGVDSRITNVNGDVIISDDQRKYFELSSTRPIICTFTGSVDDWYSMYEDVRKKEPKTVSEASDLAKDYLVKYAEKYRVLFAKHKKEYGECVTIGTLIAGYDEKEGYQLYSVSLDDNNKPSRKKLNLATLGTGEELAKNLFTHKRYGKHKRMNIHSASELAYKALLNATCFDKSAGGTLHVLHLDTNNFTIAHSSVLDVNYFYYGSLSVDERSLFLLYSKKIDPITKDGDLRKLIESIWPGGEVKLGIYDLQAAHLVAQSQKGYCFHRLVFDSEWTASKAYNCIPLNQNTGTSPYLEDLVAKESFRRYDHDGHLLYVGESSKIALGRICKMMK